MKTETYELPRGIRLSRNTTDPNAYEIILSGVWQQEATPRNKTPHRRTYSIVLHRLADDDYSACVFEDNRVLFKASARRPILERIAVAGLAEMLNRRIRHNERNRAKRREERFAEWTAKQEAAWEATQKALRNTTKGDAQ